MDDAVKINQTKVSIRDPAWWCDFPDKHKSLCSHFILLLFLTLPENLYDTRYPPLCSAWISSSPRFLSSLPFLCSASTFLLTRDSHATSLTFSSPHPPYSTSSPVIQQRTLYSSQGNVKSLFILLCYCHVFSCSLNVYNYSYSLQ